MGWLTAFSASPPYPSTAVIPLQVEMRFVLEQYLIPFDGPVHRVRRHGHVPRSLTDGIELGDVSEAFSAVLRKSQMLRKTSDAVDQKGTFLAFRARI
ncbi:hypothetical protein TNCV_4974341 [Trichonephila clavipes]|uniref:Uncharacterized protein n=1 Tax=Trichonephila clavipes TaxID=2585209 RepID=A0A8X6VLK2_TRICX|nr:hypothetical protein TNCV_4974341 [Trichonephila clavipes]